MTSFSLFLLIFLLPPQYDDLLSQFSNMQVTPAVEAPSPTPVSVPSPAPTYNPTLSVDQFIHDLDSNSMELDLLFSDEEKRLLLDKQCAVNPWYSDNQPVFLTLVFFGPKPSCISPPFCMCFRHQFVENNLILKMGPVDKRKVREELHSRYISILMASYLLATQCLQLFRQYI